jgi:hypothetical protein
MHKNAHFEVVSVPSDMIVLLHIKRFHAIPQIIGGSNDEIDSQTSLPTRIVHGFQ